MKSVFVHDVKRPAAWGHAAYSPDVGLVPRPGVRIYEPTYRISKSVRSMLSGSRTVLSRLGIYAFASWLAGTPLLAFPPAPYHTIYGVVRDEYGTPLTDPDSLIILKTPSGIQLQANVIPGLGAGINYQVQVPMDAGLTPYLYRATALLSQAPFTMFVVSGGVTNTPIQMAGDYSHLGRPSENTRLDLTLGVDANGDGIPDAWEYAFLAALNSDLNLHDLRPELDLAHDGRSLLQEYLLGAYPFNPDSLLNVRLVTFKDGAPILEFPTQTGRSYTVLGSSDLQQWMPLTFSVPAEGPGAGARSFYSADNGHTLQVQVILPSPAATTQFFKVLLQ